MKSPKDFVLEAAIHKESCNQFMIVSMNSGRLQASSMYSSQSMKSSMLSSTEGLFLASKRRVFESNRSSMKSPTTVYYVPEGQNTAIAVSTVPSYHFQDFLSGLLQCLAGTALVAFMFGLLSTNVSSRRNSTSNREMASG